MATMRQKMAVSKILENHGKISTAMRESGYMETTSSTPKNLTNSKGFKQLMKECGLTEELISTALVDDIKAKKKNRVAELGLGAKILKMTDNDETKQGHSIAFIVWGSKDGGNPIRPEGSTGDAPQIIEAVVSSDSSQEIRKDNLCDSRGIDESTRDTKGESESRLHSSDIQDGEEYSVGLPEALL